MKQVLFFKTLSERASDSESIPYTLSPSVLKKRFCWKWNTIKIMFCKKKLSFIDFFGYFFYVLNLSLGGYKDCLVAFDNDYVIKPNCCNGAA